MISRQEPRRPATRLAFSLTEAAASLGIGTETFLKMVSKGSLPIARDFEGRKRWLVSELQHAIQGLHEYHGEEHQPGRNPWDREDEVFRPRFPKKPSEYERGDHGLPPEQRLARYQFRLRDWRKRVPGSELNGLEKLVLEQLSRYGVDKPVRPSVIARAGPVTQETLELRTYIGIRKSTKDPSKTHSIWITEAGFEEIKPKPPTKNGGRWRL